MGARAGLVAGAITAGILTPAGTALGADEPQPAAPQNLTPEEEAQQIAELGDPPPDAQPIDEEPAPDPEETPDGLPASPDDELDQEPGDELVTPPPADLSAPDEAPSAPPAATKVVNPPATSRSKHPAAPKPAAPPVVHAERPQRAEHAAPAPAPIVPARPATTPPVRASAPPSRVKGGGKVHVVQAGESLWSIASQLLGDDATPARIAALVDELWRLNAGRIGSGSPSMIHAGDELLVPQKDKEVT